MNDKTKIMIDMNEELITIFDGKAQVGELAFLIDETQINVSDITIVDELQRQGFGCLLMNTIKGIAQFYKKPIYLISYMDKIEFYKKVEFFSMSELIDSSTRKGKKVSIMNLNPQRSREIQLSKADMLWIPNNIDEVEVYL